MQARLTGVWDNIRSSYWFFPSILSLAAIFLSFAIPCFDIAFGWWLLAGNPWLQISPAVAQSILTTIAGATVTVAGVVFSITIATLSIASSQLGPRLIRTFMSKTSINVVLGVFISSSIYCILALTWVRSQSGFEFVPNFSVAFGVLLAVLSMGCLIYYLQAVATLIQAPNVVQSVAYELDAAIDRLFPDAVGEAPQEPLTQEVVGRRLDGLGSECVDVTATQEGYVMNMDERTLLDMAVKHDLILRIHCQPGEFIIHGSVLMRAWPKKNCSDELTPVLRYAFLTGNRRTPRQDIECAVNELVEIAVRALSPSLNDPFTAINCIDRLGASLSRLAKADMPSPYRYDSEGALRIIFVPVTFKGILDAAFDQIRQYGRDSTAVIIRLLDILALLMSHAKRQSDRDAILRQASMIKNGCNQELIGEDLGDVMDRYAEVIAAAERTRHDDSERDRECMNNDV